MLSFSHNKLEDNKMTKQTTSRLKETQAIWKQYQGLYVVAGILIGLLLFPFLELVITDLSALLIGLVPEAIGIGLTIFFLDRIYARHDTERLKKRLIHEVSSQSYETAKLAVDWMHHEGWLTGEDGLLKGVDLSGAKLEKAFLINANLKSCGLYDANLKNAKLVGTDFTEAELSHAHLEGAWLVGANLDKALLIETHLEDALLNRASLKQAMLSGAHLKQANLDSAQLNEAKLHNADLRGANLMNADLRGTNLSKADLRGVDLHNAKLDDTIIWATPFGKQPNIAILPDGSTWEADIIIEQFTDGGHPDYETMREKINAIRQEMGMKPLPSQL
jgi:uncharacterized protein YjbI with pentapeptide repeats